MNGGTNEGRRRCYLTSGSVRWLGLLCCSSNVFLLTVQAPPETQPSFSFFSVSLRFFPPSEPPFRSQLGV